MIDCELRGLKCELAASNLGKPQKCDVRPDGGVVTQRTANPLSAPRFTHKFARFMLRSTYGIPWDLSAAANSTLRLRIQKRPRPDCSPNEAKHAMEVAMPGSEIAVEDRPHYTNQTLVRDPHYQGKANIWSPEEALAVMRELLMYFDLTRLPPPPKGLPGRNSGVDRAAFKAVKTGASYLLAVLEGRPGRQWDFYKEMEDALQQAYYDGVHAEKECTVSERTKQAAEEYAAWERGEPLPGFAYFISGDDGPIKIGTTVDVANRLRGLQTSHPARLSVLATAPGGRATEREYHERFAAHRLHGEWFARHPDILAEIARINREAMA